MQALFSAGTQEEEEADFFSLLTIF